MHSNRQDELTHVSNTVQAGLASTEQAQAVKPMGVAEELEFDTPLGHGKWSVAPAADGKSYVTLKASGCSRWPDVVVQLGA